MKAIIMAGGEGKRLRPLTETHPKPLLPIDGVPAIRRILRLLQKHGIQEAAVTTGYLADKLERHLGSEAEGVTLTYFREKTPLGTAGGVAAARDYLSDAPFLVISGDAVCRCDLSAAIRAREEQRAMALLILTRVASPGEFGVVLLDETNRITGFSEKPSLSGTYSDTVNTGIYVLSPSIFEEIPSGIPYDFGRDLFPKLLSQGKPLAGIIDTNTWFDIGDTTSYRNANLDASGGQTVIGQSCLVPSEGIVRSVICDYCRIGDNCRITGSILAEGVTVGRNTVFGEGCVIGAYSVIGDNVVLAANTVLPSYSRIPDGTRLRSDRHTIRQTEAASLLSGSGLICPLRDMTTTLAITIGRALAAASHYGRIGLLHDGSTAADRAVSALLRGMNGTGTETLLLGEGFEAAASHAAIANKLTLALFVGTEKEHLRIALFDEVGLYPKRDFERALLLHLSEERELPKESPHRAPAIHTVEDDYLPMVIQGRCPLEGLRFRLTTDNAASACLTQAMLKLGGTVGPGGLRLAVSRSGFLLSMEQDGFVADDWHIKALLLRYLIRDRVSLPSLTPTALLDLCHSRYTLYSHCPTGQDEDTARRMTATHPALQHAAVAAVELAGLIVASGQSLRELSARLPSFAVGLSAFDTTAKHRLGILPHLGFPSGDGVIATYASGNVRIIPSRRGFRLIAEAVSSENAEELLSLSRKEIERLIAEHS